MHPNSNACTNYANSACIDLLSLRFTPLIRIVRAISGFCLHRKYVLQYLNYRLACEAGFESSSFTMSSGSGGNLRASGASNSCAKQKVESL